MSATACSRAVKTCFGNASGIKNTAALGRKWCQSCLDWSRGYREGASVRCAEHGDDAKCALCRKKAARAAAHYANARELNLKRVCASHGITIADYEQLLREQAGTCAICRQPETSRQKYRGDRITVKRLAIDHNHETNEVRGLLCNNCNRALGMFKDDPAVLRSAAEYVEGSK